jgi:hypothetical protein
MRPLLRPCNQLRARSAAKPGDQRPRSHNFWGQRVVLAWGALKVRCVASDISRQSTRNYAPSGNSRAQLIAEVTSQPRGRRLTRGFQRGWPGASTPEASRSGEAVNAPFADAERCRQQAGQRSRPRHTHGQSFRRYWLPAMLSEALPEPDCAPVKLRLLGEDPLAFRMTSGAAAVVDRWCPHRNANLYWGRNEEEGIRGVHGWKFHARDVVWTCQTSRRRVRSPRRFGSRLPGRRSGWDDLGVAVSARRPHR